jgi:redox-sensitive bicupin YhaK (pirin superfamily)
LGNEALITAGEIQRMSAGTGIRHSEWNPSKTETAHLLQIWVRPDEKGVTPSYAQQPIDVSQSGWTALASPVGDAGPITIHQQAWLWQGLFSADKPMPEILALKAGHGAWLQMISGELQSSVSTLKAGDGAGVQPEEWPHFYAQLTPVTEVKVLLFALPMNV